MPNRRGTVWIAPAATLPVDERMVDAETAVFWLSWQDDGLDTASEDTSIAGAEAAIAWGHERAPRVLIRLGHSTDMYFSAGDQREPSVPPWPPAGTAG